MLGFFQRVWEVVQRHRRMTYFGLGGLLLLFLGVNLTTYLQNRRQDEARTALAQMRPLLSKPEAAEEALEGLARILADYPNTPPAKEAAVYRAHLLYQTKKYADAAKAYAEAAKLLDEKDGLAPLIAESLSYCYEALGDFHQGATVLAPVLNKESGPLRSELLRRAAWLSEKAGNAKEAARYWRLLLEKPPNPAMVPYFKEKLAALEAAAGTPPK
jgi:lipopolysaccharide biosynthesis regulator YciM